MKRAALALVVSVALVLALVPASVGAQPRQERDHTSTMNRLERFLAISETGNLVLDAPKGIVESIDGEVYRSLLAGLGQTNSMIDSGYLVANPDFTLTVTEKLLQDSSQQLAPNRQLVAEGNAVYSVEGAQTLSSSGGVDAIYYHWWGFDLYMSSETTHLIMLMLAAGATAAFIAAFICSVFPPIGQFVGAAIGIAGALVVLGAALLAYFNRHDTGVVVRYVILLGFCGIWSQGPSGNPSWGVIKGYVYYHDPPYGAFPLPGAEVTVAGTGITVFTGQDGCYEIYLEPGTYTLTATHNVFYPQSYHNVQVVNGEQTIRNFTLDPKYPGAPVPLAIPGESSVMEDRR